MSLQFTCGACGHSTDLDESQAGKLILCDHCGHRQRTKSLPGSVQSRKKLPAELNLPKAKQPSKVSAVHGTVPLKRGPNVALLGTCVLLMVAMFMPWVSWPDNLSMKAQDRIDSYVPGILMPFVFQSAIDRERQWWLELREKPNAKKDRIDDRLEKLERVSDKFTITYVLLLVPLIAVGAFIDEILGMGKGANHWPLRLAVLWAPFMALGVVWMTFSYVPAVAAVVGGEEPETSSLIEWIGLGVWLLPLAIVGGILGLVFSPEPKRDEWQQTQSRQRRPA